jgi:nascent polypeptide-associated complex subunit alpha
MIPGMNPRQMKQAMKRLGIQQDEIDANEVIIRCDDRDIVISNPSVVKVNMGGQKTYQISGEEEERSIETVPELDEEDIKTVMDQAEVSREKAKEAILEANYDLAEAILSLKK